jgi:hypothetical protein
MSCSSRIPGNNCLIARILDLLSSFINLSVAIDCLKIPISLPVALYNAVSSAALAGPNMS